MRNGTTSTLKPRKDFGKKRDIKVSKETPKMGQKSPLLGVFYASERGKKEITT
jgi:hypothetical protein